MYNSLVDHVRTSFPPHGVLSPSSCISLSPPSTSYRTFFLPSTGGIFWSHCLPDQAVPLAIFSIALRRLRSVHAAKTRLSKSSNPNGTPTPTPILVASELESPVGVAVTVVTADVFVLEVSLTGVASNVVGANGFPKMLGNVALQQLVLPSSEQQNRPL